MGCNVNSYVCVRIYVQIYIYKYIIHILYAYILYINIFTPRVYIYANHVASVQGIISYGSKSVRFLEIKKFKVSIQSRDMKPEAQEAFKGLSLQMLGPKINLMRFLRRVELPNFFWKDDEVEDDLGGTSNRRVFQKKRIGLLNCLLALCVWGGMYLKLELHNLWFLGIFLSTFIQHHKRMYTTFKSTLNFASWKYDNRCGSSVLDKVFSLTQTPHP